MYRIIGGNGKQYGPVSAEVINEWIAEGRAAAFTQVQVLSTPETAAPPAWKRLGDLPEFATALAGSELPPHITPAEAAEERLPAREFTLGIGECVARGWEVVKGRFWLATGGAAVLMIIHLLMSVLPFVGMLADICLGLVLWAGFDWLLLKLLRGEPARFGDIFSGFSLAFLPLLLASIVSGVLISVGLILCILPGLYLMMIWWMFTPLLIIDRGMEFWAAMELSRKVVHRNLGPMIGLFFVTLVLTLAGLLLACVGIFFTIAFSSAAMIVAYENIFGPQREGGPGQRSAAPGSSAGAQASASPPTSL